MSIRKKSFCLRSKKWYQSDQRNQIWLLFSTNVPRNRSNFDTVKQGKLSKNIKTAKKIDNLTNVKECNYKNKNKEKRKSIEF